MQETSSKILNKIIWLIYLALATITPLIFSTQNSEVFEVPKMLFVYFGAVIILFATCLKFVQKGKITIPKNKVFLAFLAFITIQTLSTLFSIDKFTSVFGYPTRLNGGLLSQFAYLVLFAGALINISKDQAKKLIIASVISAFAVALWGIPSHFNLDPTCFVLIHRLTSSCWQIDFNPMLRIFSTLGQPNWLASYLVLILPVSAALFLSYKKTAPKIFFLVATAAIFLAFLLTNSRSGIFGLIVSALIFTALLGTRFLKKQLKILTPAAIALIIIFAIFGQSLIGRFSEIFTANGTGPTESSSIRIIVWQGAFKVFKHWPILGSGPETFAYSYYQFRPLAHNQTTEWNFYYNKAHNEFLNYLANTGILGFGAYLILIATSLIYLFRISTSKELETSLIAKATIASILGYLTTIFFGFSTVTSSLLLFLLIGLVLTQITTEKDFYSSKISFPNSASYYISLGAILLLGLFTLITSLQLYLADTYYARAKSTTNAAKQLISFNNAITIFPTGNPFYLTEFAFQLSSSGTKNTDLLQQAADSANLAAKLAPDNLLVLRNVANSYSQLSNLDKSYGQKSLDLSKHLIDLAPTDPQSYLDLAKIQLTQNMDSDAKLSTQKALNLKKDYVEAQELLDQLNAKEYNKNTAAPQN